jgi:hypothetical protein
MIEIVGIALFFVILYAIFPKRNGFRAIERQHAMRQSIVRLQEKSRRYG